MALPPSLGTAGTREGSAPWCPRPGGATRSQHSPGPPPAHPQPKGCTFKTFFLYLFCFLLFVNKVMEGSESRGVDSVLRGGHVAPVTPMWGALGKGWGGEIRPRSLFTFRHRRSGHRGQRWTRRGHAQPLGPSGSPPRPRGSPRLCHHGLMCHHSGVLSPKPGIFTKATVQLACRHGQTCHHIQACHQQPPCPRSHPTPCLGWRWGCCRLFLAVPVLFRVPSLGSPPGPPQRPRGTRTARGATPPGGDFLQLQRVCIYIYIFFKI